MVSEAVPELGQQLRANPFTPDRTIAQHRSAMPNADAEPGPAVTPLTAAGVPGEWVVADAAGPGRIHSFPFFAFLLPEGREAIGKIGDFTAATVPAG